MPSLRFRRVTLGVLLAVVGSAPSCGEPNTAKTVSVSLKNTETYQYPTVSGDEEGARISTQASHFRMSEIRRNADTHFVAVYVYQPVAGFVGSDFAEIEILTGSDGASAPTRITKVAFRFVIHN